MISFKGGPDQTAKFGHCPSQSNSPPLDTWLHVRDLCINSIDSPLHSLGNEFGGVAEAFGF